MAADSLTGNPAIGGPPPVQEDDEEEPRPQLSVLRVLVAMVLGLALIGGVAVAVDRSITAAPSKPAGATWFAPYVDATLTPLAQFQDPGTNPARQVVLGFVVADPHQGCSPSWGGYYSLAGASQSLSLDSRIAEVRAQGGNVVVSFGGQANSELAVTCSSIPQLTAAYRSVISRYQLTTVDLDVEGAALDDPAATARRGAALASLQRAAKGAHSSLSVWLTLPVAPTGLAPDALSVVEGTLRAGVNLGGVNVMAMDFGPPEPRMGGTVQAALVAAHAQLEGVYRRYGLGGSSAGAWNRMGVTVMIGQNDSPGEIFTVADAQALLGFVRSRHVRRVSMWSLNRDTQCGSSFAIVGVHSNTCSGTDQANLAFSRTLAGLGGAVSSAAGQPSLVTTPPVSDNPATSPYPVWQPTRPYITGYKVVRDGYIYQAKWYSQGQDPAAQVQSASATPWQLLGPVLPGDHAPTTTTLPAGTYPTWSAETAYTAGQRVLYQGLPYKAKWYNKATSPGQEQADPSSSPWEALYTIPGEPAGG